MPVDDRSQPLSRADWIVVLVSLVLPTAVTWLYFVALDGAAAAAQQMAYGIGKAIQFALPALWVCCVQQRGRFAVSKTLQAPPLWSLLGGALFGLLIGAAMIAFYFALQPMGLFDESASAVRTKVQSFGAGSSGRFLLLAIFYSAVHSVLEEYYWRWFVFGQLRRGCLLPIAIGIGSIAFAAHHVLVLGHYFGYLVPTAAFTWLFTLAIVIGGAFWAWLYQASRSLGGPCLSHALVDAAIFAVGWQMIGS
jgi:CAAX protease family protein